MALWPDTPYDRAGVYSGNTVIDSQGFPCALYSGNVAGHRETYGMLARSTDGWSTWQKTMVMDNAQRPNTDSPVHWDGQGWRDGQRCCRLVGGATGGSDRQGAAWAGMTRDAAVSDPITVRVLLDRSMLEVYCGGAARTGRTFPSPESLGIDLFAEDGAARLIALDVWQMRPMWDGVPLRDKASDKAISHSEPADAGHLGIADRS